MSKFTEEQIIGFLKKAEAGWRWRYSLGRGREANTTICRLEPASTGCTIPALAMSACRTAADKQAQTP